MTGTIKQLQTERGTGSLVGEDGKTYAFRRSDLRDAWFHELTIETKVTFEPNVPPRELRASAIRLVR
jgi:cold shock CspA family protein